jgi:hypothetical protein
MSLTHPNLYIHLDDFVQKIKSKTKLRLANHIVLETFPEKFLPFFTYSLDNENRNQGQAQIIGDELNLEKDYVFCPFNFHFRKLEIASKGDLNNI